MLRNSSDSLKQCASFRSSICACVAAVLSWLKYQEKVEWRKWSNFTTKAGQKNVRIQVKKCFFFSVSSSVFVSGAPPEPAAASAVAEGRRAAAEGGRTLNHRLQGGTLPHQTGGLQVVPAAGQLLWGRRSRMQEGRWAAGMDGRRGYLLAPCSHSSSTGRLPDRHSNYWHAGVTI